MNRAAPFRRSTLSTLIAVTLITGGCAVGPDFVRPAPPKVESYTRQPLASTVGTEGAGGATQHFVAAAEVPEKWWALFGSPALNDLVEQAFAHSPTVESAGAALRQAQENTAAQFGAWFPTVQANYNASRQQNAVGTIAPTLSSGAPTYTLHTAQLSVTYLPDVFGLNRRTLESLRAQEEVQQYQLQAARLTLASNVVAAAIQEASLRAQIQALEAIVQADSDTLDTMRHQFELGYLSGLDVANQETSLAQTRQLLPGLRKQLEQTRDLLAVLTGRLPAEVGEEAFDLEALHLPEELPVSLPANLVERRPDLRAAEAQVHSASAQVGMAAAARFPQFSLSAAYGGSATEFGRLFADSNTFWSITGGVTQTLLDFGTLAHREKSASAGLDLAKAQYRLAVLNAFQNVADSLYALNADAEALAAAVTAEESATRALDMTRKRLTAGAGNALSVYNADHAYQQSRMTRIQAQAMRYTDTVALFQALGGAWDHAAETAPQTDTKK